VATEKLNINGDDNGWPTGDFTDVDEAVASADGAVMATTTENDLIIFDLDASVIEDADTVTAVDMVIRGREGAGAAGTNSFRVTLLIGGAGQGAVNSATLTTSFQNLSLSAAGWDVDWTAAQMDGMQVQVEARQVGMAASGIWEIDCLDVDIVFTEGAGGLSIPVAMNAYRQHHQGFI